MELLQVAKGPRYREVPPLNLWLAYAGEGLLDIRNDVIDMLDAHRDADQVFRYTGASEFLGSKLTVRRGSGMAGQ